MHQLLVRKIMPILQEKEQLQAEEEVEEEAVEEGLGLEIKGADNNSPFTLNRTNIRIIINKTPRLTTIEVGGVFEEEEETMDITNTLVQ